MENSQQESQQKSQQVFERLRLDFDKYAEQTYFKDFWNNVYNKQAEPVSAYLLEAFAIWGAVWPAFLVEQDCPQSMFCPSLDAR